MTIRHNLERALLAAKSGALVLTSNTRAARNLRREFADHQRAAGLAAWESPDILPWSAWLKRLWDDQIIQGKTEFSMLLDEAQERLVWERIIDTEQTSLDAASLAKQCIRAWQLLHAFDIPRERSLFQKTKDTATFFCWMAAYSSRCHNNGWLDDARLMDVVGQSAAASNSRRQIVLWGFDSFTPQQRRLLDRLKQAGVCFEVLHTEGEPASATRVSLDDTESELRAAAGWARSILEDTPNSKIGIVVPNLHEVRGSVERVLLEVLHPDALTISGTDRRRAFDISLGTPLAEAPVIAAGLMVLEISAGPVSIEIASRLLRSSFIGNTSELGARCSLDVQLRSENLSEVSLGILDHWASQSTGIPMFAASLSRLKKHVDSLPRIQTAGRWSREILELLNASEWPGSRTETSAEYQARQAFFDLLGKFARYDLVLEPLDFASLFRRIRALASETLFQPENLGAPIQVLGMLEASGSYFDRLWVTGMHADAWPPPPSPSPLLPLQLQHDAKVTGSTSQERLEYAQQVTARLLNSALEVIFSLPKRDDNQELIVSPLIAEFPSHEIAPSTHGFTAEVLFEARSLVTFADSIGPSLSEPRSSGGTKIFQLQAACPFRAFAELRLGAKELEMPTPGLDRRLRGGLLHKALELTWKRIQSSNVLHSKTKVELEEIVRRSVTKALSQSDAASLTGWEGQVAEIERERLVGLILDFLALEAQRTSPFRLHEAEERKDVELGGVATHVAVDRVDVLEDGRYVLLDYKSGKPTVSSWDGTRPDEPQLPIYATQLKDKLAAVAFVQIAKGNIGFKGYGKDDRLLPNLKAFDGLPPGRRPLPTWDDLLASWEATLERLGREYREGRAEVDPKIPGKTCQYCHLGILCRINEAPPISDEGNDE
jgi:ATP-dependent helicase/nuclease subunit B